MCHPKREEIAGGEKITFEPTHIIKSLVIYHFLGLTSLLVKNQSRRNKSKKTLL